MSKEDKTKNAQTMAENFAKERARRFFRNFLEDTGLNKILIEYYTQKDKEKAILEGKPIPLPLTTEDFVDDYQMAFGRWLALSYGVGFLDCQEKRVHLKIVKED